MLLNDLIAWLSDMPPVLAAQWAAWFFLGLILSVWTRREKARLVFHPSSPRQKSGVRPPSGVRSAAPRAKTPAPASTPGDAFGELEVLLDQPAGVHRTPGDAPYPSDDNSFVTNTGSAGFTR
jgi:hypothetical protein